jgi:hypothetical protein
MPLIEEKHDNMHKDRIAANQYPVKAGNTEYDGKRILRKNGAGE